MGLGRKANQVIAVAPLWFVASHSVVFFIFFFPLLYILICYLLFLSLRFTSSILVLPKDIGMQLLIGIFLTGSFPGLWLSTSVYFCLCFLFFFHHVLFHSRTIQLWSFLFQLSWISCLYLSNSHFLSFAVTLNVPFWLFSSSIQGEQKFDRDCTLCEL